MLAVHGRWLWWVPTVVVLLASGALVWWDSSQRSAFDARLAALIEDVGEMNAEIAALEQRRDKTIAIKQGMMQQLLTGKVRLLKSEH